MVVKWPTRALTDQGPISGLVLSKHPTFLDSQKEYEMQKAARVKEPRKKRKRARKRFKSGNGPKKWLMGYAHTPN